jgi:hypothetical protein
MAVNGADDKVSFDALLRQCLAAPADEKAAGAQIRKFAEYIERIAAQIEKRDGSRRTCPKVGSVPFFLSYFWQVERRDVWPVYYTSSVNALSDMNLWRMTDDLADDYVAFKRVHEELAAVFTRESGVQFGLYEVEHVFWFREGNPRTKVAIPIAIDPISATATKTSQPVKAECPVVQAFPESYVPPIVAAIEQMSVNDAAMERRPRRRRSASKGPSKNRSTQH